MKILVTGGAGFIGSAVVRHIINNTQDSVVNVDKLTYAGNLESLADVSDSERYVFEHADICDAAAMARIFAQHQPDAVMHLAAESHVDRSITGPALMNPLMILVKIIKLRWIHILSYDQMVSRKINNQTTRCANSIFYTTLFTNSAPNYT